MKKIAISLLLTAVLAAFAQDEEGGKAGKVFIKSEPAGAAIFLGVKDEKGPFTPKDTGKKTNALIELPIGKQTVTLRLEGYEDAVFNVVVNPSAISKPDAVAMKRPARLVDILFADDGWSVAIDGKPAMDANGKPAATPCTVKLLLGKHEFFLSKEGFKDVLWNGEVADKTVNLEIKGVPEKTDQNKSPAAAATASKGTTVNLLPLINPVKDAVSGTWIWKEEGLSSSGISWARLQIPYQPPEEYDLHVSFTRTAGSDGVNLILASPGRQFMWWMGDWGNTLFGFHVINGKALNDNPTAVKQGLETKKKYSCVIKIRKDSVSAILDDKTLVEYKTDLSDFSLRPEWSLRDNRLIGLGTSSPAVFNAVEVIEVSGPGKVMRP